MGHIRHLFAVESLFGFNRRVRNGMVRGSASGGSMTLRRKGWLVVVVALVTCLTMSDGMAQPRGGAQRSQQPAPPAQPPTGHQSEPVDLNEGKSPAELFKAGCEVCHQSAAGLAKGRREGELTNFLRQHYTSSVQHAGALASFLTSGGRGGPAVAAPSRQPPVERPPASVGRKPADEDRKPQEAARPPEREPASKRKPPAAAIARPAPAPAQPEPTPAPEPTTSASSPPVEEKPPAPEIPL
jgi:hypothetical protein